MGETKKTKFTRLNLEKRKEKNKQWKSVLKLFLMNWIPGSFWPFGTVGSGILALFRPLKDLYPFHKDQDVEKSILVKNL